MRYPMPALPREAALAGRPLYREHPIAVPLLALGGLALAIHIGHAVLGVGGSGFTTLNNDWIYNLVFLTSAVACLVRGTLVREARLPWLLIGAGLASWALGDVWWTIFFEHAQSVPYPSIADAFYLASYPALYAAILLLVKARVRRFPRSLWLDGAIGCLAVAAGGAALLAPTLSGSMESSPAVATTNLAYVLGDLLLLVFVVGAVAMTGWRPGRRWLMIAGGIGLTALADAVYLHQASTSGYVAGTWLDSLWIAGAFMIAVAAWSRQPKIEARELQGYRLLVFPTLFALVALLLGGYSQFHDLHPLVVALTTATLFMVLVRMIVTYGENLRLLAGARHESVTDGLTGLANRRKLLLDIEESLGAGPSGEHVLALLDLDGFKAYNDSFGHPAGDSLLRRLGAQLVAAVAPHGSAYRLGGDEFCVLASTARLRGEAIVLAAQAALSEQGQGFSISASWGMACLPGEAETTTEALRLVDQRMYAQKGRRADDSALSQTREVLLSVLRERQPEFHDHLRGVARLAAAMGREMGLDAEELDVLVRAAEMHDVGKMAIPDEILRKPGPLNDGEWELMRRHPLSGERVLAAAPAMSQVAKLVRASHEHWDGSGYPDGLSGEEIPRGARTILVCDAYYAMTEDRPYRETMTAERAIEELRRCSGTQFDPELVKLFVERVQPAVYPGPPPEDTLSRPATSRF
jgi:two-component system, cell cycle response regulator